MGRLWFVIVLYVALVFIGNKNIGINIDLLEVSTNIYTDFCLIIYNLF